MMKRTPNVPEQRQPSLVRFEQLARIEIKQGTYLVISLRSDGNVSIAQQIEMISGEKLMHLYLKNAIEVSPEVLFPIKQAFEDAIAALFALEQSA